MHKKIITPLMLLLMSGGFAFAQEDASAVSETTYIFNTLLFLIGGVLVMFMAAGFAMLEAGMVRTKNVAVILTKNITLYALAGIMFYIVGYDLMYADVDGGYIGSLNFFWAADDSAAASGDFSAGYAATSDWFFQMVFVATAASIVSGALAERIRIWSFFVFVVVLTGFIYPIAGSWKWGAGWLDQLGFLDFAGSTLVHSVGGWAALAGALLLGARNGRFNSYGTANMIPGSSLSHVTLGVFILWLGWFGFNGGSQLALGSAADAIAVANIFANTNAAAAGGVVFVMLASRILYRRLDVVMVLNGALAGLVSITAEPLTPDIGQSVVIGGIGALIMMASSHLLEKLRIDDVVGAIPVHLFAGIWGTLAVCITNDDASLSTQLIGILAYAAFAFIASFIVWFILKVAYGIRLHFDQEDQGGDLSEVGIRAYNLDFDPANSRNK
ncbi:MAG: ammonium transporter [Pseudomonadota bacterium]